MTFNESDMMNVSGARHPFWGIKKFGLAGLLFFLLGSVSWGFNCVSNVASGNWGTAGSWTSCNGTTPQTTDNVTIQNGHTITLNASPTISSITIKSGGRLNFDASNRTLTLTGTVSPPFTFEPNAGLDANNGTVVFNGNASFTLFVGTPTLNNLSLTPTITAARVYTVGSTNLTIAGNFTVNPTKSTAGTATLTVNMSGPITVGASGTTTVTGTTNGRGVLNTVSGAHHALTTGLINLPANGTLTVNNSTITLTGTSGTIFTRAGTFNQGNSHVIYSGDGAPTLMSGTVTFYKLTLSPSITTDRTYTLGAGALTINGDFLIQPDKSTVGNSRLSVNMGAAITVAATMMTTIGGTGNALSTLNTSGSNWALSSGDIDIDPSGMLVANNSNITLTGTSGTLFINDGTFNPGGSTVIFNPNADVQLTSGNIEFNNLSLTPTITAGRAYTFGGGTLMVWGNLTINPTAASALRLTVNLGNDLVVASTRTLSITGTTAGLSTLDTTVNSYDITAGLLSIATAGTLYANDSIITLNSTTGTLLTETGTFVPGTSEVIMNPDAAITMTASGLTFYDLTLSPTLTATRAWSVGTTSITVLNNFTINPTAGAAAALNVTMGAAMGVGQTLDINGSGSASSSLNTGTNYALTSGRIIVGADESLTANASAITLNGTSGTLFTLQGLFNRGTATLTVNSDADVQVFDGGFTLNALSFSPTITGDRVYTIGGSSLTLNGNFTINPTKSTAGNATLTVTMSSAILIGAAYTATVSGTTNGYGILDAGSGLDYPLTTGKVVINANGTYTARNSTITLTATTSTLWTRTGTFNPGASHVIVTPDAAVTLFSGTQNFHHLTFSPTITLARAYTLGTGATLNLTGDFVLNPSAASALALTATMGAALNLSSNGTLRIMRSGSATSTLDASANNYVISAGYVDLQNGGTLNGRSSQIGLSGTSGTLWTHAGTFTTTASTITFNPDADVTLTNGTLSVNHVVLSPTLTTDRVYETVGGDLTINGIFTIVPSKPTAGEATLDVNMGGGITVGAAYPTILDASGNAYSELDTVLGSNYTLSTGRLDIRTRGIMRARSANIILTGTSGTLISNAGNFDAGNSLVSITPNATVTLTSGAIEFYDLSLTPTISLAQAYTFGSGAMKVLNNFTVNPTATGRLLTVNLGAPFVVEGNTLLTRTNTATTNLTTTASNYPLATGTLDIQTGATFTANASTITITGTTSPLITRIGTFTQGTSTVTVTSATDATLNSGTITFQHLIIDTPNQVQSLGAAVTVSGNLIVNNGTLSDAGFQITGNATNRLAMASGTELRLGSAATATPFPTLYTAANISLNVNSTVTYNSGQNQTISATPTYGNLALVAPSGTPTKTQANAVVVAGDLNIGANNTYDVSATNFQLTIGRNFLNNGTFNARAGTVILNGTTSGLSLSGNMTGSSDFNNLTFNGTGGQWTLQHSVAVVATMTVTAGTVLGSTDVTVNGGVVGNGSNGTITLSGGTFEHRIATDQYFGSNAAGANDWTFHNVTFSNSAASNRSVFTSANGSGRIVVNGVLSVGSNSDSNTTTLNQDTNDRQIDANGDVVITNKGTWQASASLSLGVRGNWTNRGTFAASGSTISFNGVSAQTIDHAGQAFANVVSSNTSVGGIIFSSSFSATRLHVVTSDLGASATLYFAGQSTFTISSVSVSGTASFPVVLKSTSSGTYWFLNNTSTNSVRYAQVQDSYAASGRRLLNYPGGTDLGHNVNWAFGATTPTGLSFSDAQTNSLTATWSALSPTPDSYTFHVSSNSGFSAPVTSLSTSLTNATTSTLLVNTTYYVRVNSVVDTLTSAWSAVVSTSTLASVPVTAASTWTGVFFTSITVVWQQGQNPSSSTQYEVQLSTVSGFGSGNIVSSTTYAYSATLVSLMNNKTYYGRVKAINHSGLSTSWISLGSTVTVAPQVPTNFSFTASQPTSLSASWSIPNPPAETYTFELSTVSDFSGSVVSCETANAFATSPTPLSVNTTYYGRLRSINAGLPSDWTSTLSTATKANIPSVAVSTWTEVAYSSLTVNWMANGNPSVTMYTVDLATASDFTGDEFYSSSTYGTSAVFENLGMGTTYYARVKASNHSQIDTNYLSLGSTKTVAPTTCNAALSGNWSSPSTWVNCNGVGGLPLETDLITINAGVDLIVNMNATVAGIIFTPPGTSNSITHLSTVSLTVNGPVTLNQPTTNSRTSSWNINDSTATVNGLISFSGTSNIATRVSQIVITSGQLNAFNGITFAGSTEASKVIDMSGGSGRLNLKGNLTIPANSCTLNAGTAGSLFNYMDDSAAQTVRFFYAGAYNHLSINNTSASGATLNAAINATNVTGSLRVQSGTLKNGGFDIVGGAGDTFEVASGATFEMTGTSSFPTGFTTTTVGSTSLIRYLQTSTPLTITSLTYGHLDLMPSGTATHHLPAGSFVVQGDLSLGNGTNTTTVSANTNNTALQVLGQLSIAANATFSAHATNRLQVGGNWSNSGVFTHNNSTVSFEGSISQTVHHAGQAFGHVVSSNTSAAGLVFLSSFSAAQLTIRTSDLNSAATVYFNAGSTVTLSTMNVIGSASFAVTLKSSINGSPWILNNTTGQSVSYVYVKDSDASAGKRIFNYPGGVDLGGNSNWAIGLNPPASVSFDSVFVSSVVASWPASAPTGDTYTLELSTASNFSGTITSSNTASLSAVPDGALTPNTTFYARVKSIIYGTSSSYSTSASTLTLANVPATAVSTWTAVHFSSLTLTWLSNNNPSNVTLYTVELSTMGDFLADLFSSSTYNLNASFENLELNTVYYGRVKATNQNGLSTGYLLLGSTQTRAPITCNAAVSGNWSAPGTWLNCTGPGGLPNTTDSITINSAVNVTLDMNATVAGLSFASPGTNNSLTQQNTVTLLVNGNVVFNQPTTASRTNSWNINASTATVDGSITFAGNTNSATRISQLVITSGQLNVNGGMSFTTSASASKVINMSGGPGQLNLKGVFNAPPNSCTLTAGTAGSVFNFMDDISAQLISSCTAGAYNYLYVNNTSPAGATLGFNVTSLLVTGNLRVQSGTFKNGGFAIAGGAGDTFEVANGATFEMSGTSAFPTGFTTTTLGPTSRVRYLQTSTPITLSAQTYGHLDLAPSGTATQNFPAGSMTVQGDLTLGNGTTLTTVSANANNTTLRVDGDLNIQTNATFVANATNPLQLSGNWSNSGNFAHNSGTISLVGVSQQTLSHGGQTFGFLISSNTSSAGLVFSSSFTASRIYVNTAELGAATTIYFTAGSTATVSVLSLNGTATYPITLKSTVPGTYWFLNNTSTNNVSYVNVQDSYAGQGLRLLNDPAGIDLGHNNNWAFGLNAPSGLVFSDVQSSALTLAWNAATPVPDSYTVMVSTNSSFAVPVTSQSTALLSATTSSLLINTTYYGRVRSVINGTDSSWTSSISTVTLAVVPGPIVSTWTAVNYSSVTLDWGIGGNTSGTSYEVQLSSVGSFESATVISSLTLNTSATLIALTPNKTYHARVRAINHSDIPTNWLALGSTVTLAPAIPQNLTFSVAQTNSLTGTWSATAPAGDTYTLEVATSSDFGGSLVSSNTAGITATTASSLTPNTTYYGRVKSILGGVSSNWSSTITTATLANIPLTAASTWTVVHITSLTVTWQANSNPSATTLYEVHLASMSDFLSGVVFSSQTYGLSMDFDQLSTGKVYYGRVKAINHSRIDSSWLSLGSTQTQISAIPENLQFTSVQITSLSASWNPSTPAGDTYTFRVSTDSSFGGTVTSSATANLFATTASSLEPNTTYYGTVNAIVGGVPYPWAANISTVTLAYAPASVASTWTAVNITSVTVAWSNNGNPLSVTQYRVQLSTVSNFGSGTVFDNETQNLTVSFEALIPLSTYYARVLAINHSGVSTSWTSLGSTITTIPHSPSNLTVTSAQSTSLTASWTASNPVADSYTMQVSTASNFGGLLTSSNTASTSATTTSTLLVNTTYHVRVNAIIKGSSSSWTTSISSSTLANAPETAASTWTAVFLTSFTMTWLTNGNPSGVTIYDANISTASDFSGELFSSQTYNLSATFENLETDTIYYGRVAALNHSGVISNYTSLGSTQTRAPTTCNATTTGNWSTPSIWLNCTGAAGLPSVTDIVTINSAVTVTLDRDATIGGLIFAAPGTSNALTHSGTNTLTVNGNVTFNQPTLSSRNNSWNINDATATVTGLITFSGANTTSSRVSRIVINNGVLNAGGGITFVSAASATKLINMSGGAGRVNLKGTLTIPSNSCTLLTGTSGSIFSYSDDTLAQTVTFFTSGNYENLIFNNTSGAGVTLGAAINSSNVTENVIVASGTFNNGGFAITGNTGKTITVKNGATFIMSGTSVYPTGFSSFVFEPTSRIRYAQTTTPLTITSASYGHLDLMPAGAATQNFPAGSMTIAGDLQIGNGSNVTTVSANANNTTLIVQGNVSIASNATFVANATNALSVEGHWSNSGTFTASGSTVSFDGGGEHILSGNSTFYWLRSLVSGTTLQFTAGTTQYVSYGVTLQNLTLRSSVDDSAWYFQFSGSSQALTNLRVRDSDASSGILMQAFGSYENLGGNLNWDFGVPASINNLAAALGVRGRSLVLTWNAPGDDGDSGTHNTATFTIQYTTDTSFAQSGSWSATDSYPSYVYRVSVGTTNVSANSVRSMSLTSLSGGSTYYIRVWTTDDVGNHSGISNGATQYATPLILSITLSTGTLNFGSLNPGTTQVMTSSVTVTNTGNVVQDFQISVTNPPIWSLTSGIPSLDQIRLMALFKDTQPLSSDFSLANDLVSTSTTTASATIYARDADSISVKGASVAPGESRGLWFRLEMPVTSTTDQNQIIYMTGTAIESP